MNLTSSITNIYNVGAHRAENFARLNVATIRDLIQFYPRYYQDLATHTPLAKCTNADEKYCVRVHVVKAPTKHLLKGRMMLFKAVGDDGQNRVNITIFNSEYMARRLVAGKEVVLFGKVAGNFGFEMTSPEIIEIDEAKIRPIYPQTAKLSSKIIHQTISSALKAVEIKEFLSAKILQKYNLAGQRQAFEMIHNPQSLADVEQAKRRLKFDELFNLNLVLKILSRDDYSGAENLARDYFAEFLKLVPFELTSAQKRVVDEINCDLTSGKLKRLLQGDVSSGKTIVAFAACYNVVRNGGQCAFMVPTTILAAQHFKNAQKLFEGTEIKVAIISSDLKKVERDEVLRALKAGEINLIIGTHSLLNDAIEFKNLQLVITDEQHRFGVNQRAKLLEKSRGIHTLVMSATPIPRTLSLILHGDLDISIIDEKPQNRMPIETYAVNTSYRPRIYKFIEEQLRQGFKAYVICPKLTESDDESQVSAVEMHKILQEKYFKNRRVGLVHGKMKSREKDEIMNEFLGDEIDILVATTVVEVGVDVKNATVMVIENAHKFGLSQLHQLRGRVGRSANKSYCILISDSGEPVALERLNTLAATDDGFKIAEKDLLLRGPGEFFSGRQHGAPDLKLANLATDSEILKCAASEAKIIIDDDPNLAKAEHFELEIEIKHLIKDITSGQMN